MLRQLAEQWFQAKCSVGVSIAELLRVIDTAIEGDQNCWFRFGANTTNTNTPWLVYCYEEEFFAFALDKRQTALLKVNAGHVTSAPAGRRMCFPTHEVPPVTLKPPNIEVATIERIAGSVDYEMLSTPMHPYNPTPPYCLRMTWDRPDGAGINMFHYPVAPLHRVGRIPFDFQLRSPNELPVPPGLVLMFFALNGVPEKSSSSNPHSKVRALSDTHAMLVELRESTPRLS